MKSMLVLHHENGLDFGSMKVLRACFIHLKGVKINKFLELLSCLKNHLINLPENVSKMIE